MIRRAGSPFTGAVNALLLTGAIVAGIWFTLLLVALGWIAVDLVFGGGS